MTFLSSMTRVPASLAAAGSLGVHATADIDAGEVYRLYGASVRGYLKGQRVEDPDDLLGEVFYQVARSLPRFEGTSTDLRRWVFTIARNRVVDARRRRSRRPRTVALGTHDGAIAGPPDPDDELLEAIGALTEDQREVIGLRFIADLSLEDVAQLTGRTVGATKSMQHRALQQLARSLDPRAEGEQ
ncbi:RNA polymerase sigma factor [Aquihabitans daechungensis]|uniref:RNA polymerase sigma factor n=1 Tax=Aquihabitans daechungensis TaxID=1052257 RepID=UPI003B9ECA06